MGQWQGGTAYNLARDVEQAAATRTLPRLCIVRQDSADNVCKTAWKLGTVTLVIDELDHVCTAKKWASPVAHDIAHYGRHRRVDLFGSFRSTRNVNEDFPLLADYVLLMHHSSAALYDVRTLGHRFGRENAEQTLTLPPHRGLIWSDTMPTETKPT